MTTSLFGPAWGAVPIANSYICQDDVSHFETNAEVGTRDTSLASATTTPSSHCRSQSPTNLDSIPAHPGQDIIVNGTEYDNDAEFDFQCEEAENGSRMWDLHMEQDSNNSDPIDNDKHSSPYSQEDPEDYSRYDFRVAARARAPAFAGTWLDHDETGDYDPAKASRCLLRNSLKRKRANSYVDKRPIQNMQNEDAEGRQKQPRTILSARQNGNRLPVTLKFSSPEALAALAKYPDSEYLEHRNVFADDCFDPAASTSPMTASAAYKFRSRQGLDNEVEDDTLDLTGHPAARGCRECLNLGQHCSMLDPERIYPCQFCAADKLDCELVVLPKKKRACEYCKFRKMRCSYLDTDDHQSPCQVCSQHGFKCVAGPHIDPKCTRLTEDGKPGTRHDRPPRKRPRKKSKEEAQDTECVPESTQSGSNAEIQNESDQLQEEEVRVSSDECLDQPQCFTPTESRQQKAQSQETRSQDKIETIRTKLIHPIKFNHVDRTGMEPCHWCEDPIYGIMGVGQDRVVKVRQWANGKGCTELVSAPLGPAAQASRCCVNCTLLRVLVITCAKHSMRLIQRRPVNGPDWETTFSRLMEAQQGPERQHLLNSFCSLCPGIALFECCNEQWPVEAFKASPEKFHRAAGCGLRLCEPCQVVLVNAFEGDLQRMVVKMVPDPQFWPLGLRADFDFFKGDGYLVKQIMDS